MVKIYLVVILYLKTGRLKKKKQLGDLQGKKTPVLRQTYEGITFQNTELLQVHIWPVTHLLF